MDVAEWHKMAHGMSCDASSDRKLHKMSSDRKCPPCFTIATQGMPEPRDVQSVLDDAERAATAGDYITAEALLCDAAALQEASLGPFHPDLANTLNNLGVVYETLDRPSDAERCYRRAHAIAITSLEPDHPFVATSEKNLRDYCSARGIAFDPPTPLPAVEPTPAPLQTVAPPPAPLPTVAPIPATVEATPQQQPVQRPVETFVPPPPPIPVPSASRRPGMAIAGVLGVVVLIAAGLWIANRNGESPGTVESVQNAAPSQTAEPSQSTAPPAQAESTAPVRESPVATPTRVPPPTPTSSTSERPSESTGIARGTALSGQLTVDAATLCRNFSTRDWRCSPARSPIDSGQVFFYTRIKSSTPMTVEHRWYRDEHLHRVAALRIQANEQRGFRSYSGTAVKQGNWRVELRTRDGSVLAEQKFVVR